MDDGQIPLPLGDISHTNLLRILVDNGLLAAVSTDDLASLRLCCKEALQLVDRSHFTRATVWVQQRGLCDRDLVPLRDSWLSGEELGELHNRFANLTHLSVRWPEDEIHDITETRCMLEYLGLYLCTAAPSLQQVTSLDFFTYGEFELPAVALLGLALQLPALCILRLHGAGTFPFSAGALRCLKHCPLLEDLTLQHLDEAECTLYLGERTLSEQIRSASTLTTLTTLRVLVPGWLLKAADLKLLAAGLPQLEVFATTAALPEYQTVGEYDFVFPRLHTLLLSSAAAGEEPQYEWVWDPDATDTTTSEHWVCHFQRVHFKFLAAMPNLRVWRGFVVNMMGFEEDTAQELQVYTSVMQRFSGCAEGWALYFPDTAFLSYPETSLGAKSLEPVLNLKLDVDKDTTPGHLAHITAAAVNVKTAALGFDTPNNRAACLSALILNLPKLSTIYLPQYYRVGELMDAVMQGSYASRALTWRVRGPSTDDIAACNAQLAAASHPARIELYHGAADDW